MVDELSLDDEESRQVEEAMRLSLSTYRDEEPVASTRRRLEGLKRPASGAAQGGNKRSATNATGRTIVNMLDGTIEVVEQRDPSAENCTLPDCLGDVDTSFLTDSTPSPHLINLTSSGGSSLENTDEERKVQDLMERVFERSFDESGVMDVVYNVDTGQEEKEESEKLRLATERVHLITDKRSKVHRLLKSMIGRSKEDGPDSPAACKMLDKFMRRKQS